MTKALIAEDEPLLAQALQAELARAWPELLVAGIAGDGLSAVEMALEHLPDVLFFDIRMPGQTGLEAAAALADEWPQGTPFPALVFITAYDQYAVQAFETQAIDYVLKPVQPERLRKTVAKVQQQVAARGAEAEPRAPDGTAGSSTAAPGSGSGFPVAAHMQPTLDQLRRLLSAFDAPEGPSSPTGKLSVIQASVGNSIRMVPVDEVMYFEAADKYVRVLTADREYLIRTPLKELVPQLDPGEFWQIHRGTVVRATAIEGATRDEAGKLHVTLRGRPEKLAVSRLYAQHFKAM